MEVKFLSVGCGDGICIRFLGNDNNFHNIIVDGGTEKSNKYESTLKEEILSINERRERIDLWIISHIDDDHIGGILRFIKDEKLFDNTDLSETRFWYNYADVDYETGISKNSFKSVRQGIRLREFLKRKSLVQQFITDELQLINFFGANISILSPDHLKFAELVKQWRNEEIKIIQKKSSSFKHAADNDHDIKIEDFDLNMQELDNSVPNASSIAFLLEYESKKILFAADAHPDTLENALYSLGYSAANKIPLAYIQVPHHGSKFNTTDGLMKMIDCSNFIISADGYKHNLPDKKTLVRILKHQNGKTTNFFLTERNNVTTKIFSVDGAQQSIKLNFPAPGTTGLFLKI